MPVLQECIRHVFIISRYRKKLKELSAEEFLSYGLDSDVSLDGDDSSESINLSDGGIKKKRKM